jgi:hypothetical protein
VCTEFVLSEHDALSVGVVHYYCHMPLLSIWNSNREAVLKMTVGPDGKPLITKNETGHQSSAPMPVANKSDPRDQAWINPTTELATDVQVRGPAY